MVLTVPRRGSHPHRGGGNWFGALLAWTYAAPLWRTTYAGHEHTLVRLDKGQARLVGPRGWYLVHDHAGRTRYVGGRREDALATAEALLVCAPADAEPGGVGDPALDEVLRADQRSGVALVTPAGRGVHLYQTPWERGVDVYDGRPNAAGAGLRHDPLRGGWLGKIVPVFIVTDGHDPQAPMTVWWLGRVHRAGEPISLPPQSTFRAACTAFGATLDRTSDPNG